MIIKELVYFVVIISINFLMFAAGLVEASRKNSSDEKKNKRYFWGNQGRVIYSNKEENTDTLMFISFYVIAMTIFYAIAYVIYKKYPNIWTDTGKYADEIPSLMLNSFLGTMAIIGISTAINKKHYITFNIIDVLERFRIKSMVIKMIILISIVFIVNYLAVIVKNLGFLEVGFALKCINFVNLMLFLSYIFRSCWLVMSICTSNPRFEMKVLDKLYYNFAYKRIKEDTDKWDTQGVKYIMESLLDKYFTSTYSGLFCLEDISFISSLDTKKKCIKWLKFKALFLYNFIQLILLIFIGYVTSIHYQIIIFSFLLIVGFSLFCESSRVFIIFMFYDKCGYYVKFRKNSIKEKYIAIEPYKSSKWIIFFHALQNILAFYRMAYRQDKEIEEEILNCMDNCSNKDFKDLLISMILYLKYEQCPNINDWNNRYKGYLDVYCRIIINKKGIKYKIMNAIISDINRETATNDITELRNDKLYKLSELLNKKYKA